VGTFEQDQRLGREGEEAFKGMLISDPLHVQLEDVRDDPESRLRDVDFIWTTSRGRYQIEVKTEQRFTGNVFLETVSNTSTGSTGWFESSAADYIAQGFLDDRRWYLYSLRDLRRAVEPIRRELKIARARTLAPRGGYRTEGILLPIASLQFRFALLRTIEKVVTPGKTLAPLEGAIVHRTLGIGAIVSLSDRFVVCSFGVKPKHVRLDLQAVLDRQLLRAPDGTPLGRGSLRNLASGSVPGKK